MSTGESAPDGTERPMPLRTNQQSEHLRRLDLLSKVGRLLATSLDDEPRFAQVARAIVPTLGDWCTIYLREDSGAVRLVGVAHRAPAQDELLRYMEDRYPPDSNRPTRLSKVLETGTPELISEVPEMLLELAATNADHLRRLRALNPKSLLIAPLQSRGRTLGALSVSSTQSGRYQEGDLAFAAEIASRCAIALDNWYLYQAAQHAMHQQREQMSRAQALAAASQALAATRLALPAILETIVQLLSVQLGDICVLRLISDDGQWLNPVSHYHPHAIARELVQILYGTPHRVGEGLSGRVAQTGEPLLIPVIAQASIRAEIKPEYWPYLEHIGLHSLLIVPLRIRERVLGTLGISRDTPGQPYTHDDQVFLQSMADQAALAIDNGRLYQETQQAVRARNELLSLVSHDLSNPLIVIRGNAYMARERLSEEPLNLPFLTERLVQIDAAAQRMGRMIDELHDSVRMQAGQPLVIHRSATDLVALTRQIVDEHQHVLTSKHQIELMADAPSLILDCDGAQLGRVLANLLSNAIKYSPHGGAITVELTQEESDAGRYAVLKVQDHGMGIPADDLPHIFELFRRAANVATCIAGTGIGLTSARQIIEQHGGTIHVVSDVGAGATFTVRLPINPP